MTAFLLQILIVVSLGVVLYLMVRALPRVSDVDTTPVSAEPAPHWLMERLEKLDEEMLTATEKLLRRMRVALLKLDNSLTLKLKRFKREVPGETGFSLEGEGAEKKNSNGNGNGKGNGGV